MGPVLAGAEVGRESGVGWHEPSRMQGPGRTELGGPDENLGLGPMPMAAICGFYPGGKRGGDKTEPHCSAEKLRLERRLVPPGWLLLNPYRVCTLLSYIIS